MPTGSAITIKMYANGCLKSHLLLFLSYLKHHKPETAKMASGPDSLTQPALLNDAEQQIGT